MQMDDGGTGDIVLYCGLGMIMVGSVITVVGLGDKGFQTLELKLVGPIVVVGGCVLTLVCILICTLPTVRCWKLRCCEGGNRNNAKEGEENSNFADRLNKLHRSRKHGNILTTIVNREGHLQYEIVRQDCGPSPARQVGEDDEPR